MCQRGRKLRECSLAPGQGPPVRFENSLKGSSGFKVGRELVERELVEMRLVMDMSERGTVS